MVSTRLAAVSNECASKTQISTVHCTDVHSLCESDYIAVTWGTEITHCPIFWQFPVVTDNCHQYDQATLMIHETTHVDGLQDPSTGDVQGHYGWPALSWLSADEALSTADNYQHYVNCKYIPRCSIMFLTLI
jgi:deuterolysin